MITWVEFAIARHVAILRDLAQQRPLTDDEERLLDICEDESCRLLARESLPDQPRRRPRWNASVTHSPLVKSRSRD